MKCTLAAAAAIGLLTPCLLFGQSDTTSTGKNSKIESELIKLEDGFNEALIKGDTAYLERYDADELTDTDPAGSVTTKAQDIANIKSGALTITSVTNDDYKVQVYGNTAVVTYRATGKGQYKGQDISGQYRGTDTWVKRHGQWQLVASHASRIAQ
jgi:ketosteroid isomerase-like protein